MPVNGRYSFFLNSRTIYFHLVRHAVLELMYKNYALIVIFVFMIFIKRNTKCFS